MQALTNGQSQRVESTKFREDFRLSSSIKPIHYDLTLEPHFEDATYDGEVTIRLSALEEANQITLHSEDLNITAAFIRHLSGR